MDLKAALSGGNGGAISAACETGEDYTLAAFERVVEWRHHRRVLSIVEKQCGKLKEVHTRLMRLKHEIAGGLSFNRMNSGRSRHVFGSVAFPELAFRSST